MADINYLFPGKRGFVKLIFYDLSQVNADVKRAKNPFVAAQNDFAFPGTGGAGSTLVNNTKGAIKIFSPEFVYNFPGDKWKIGGYSDEISFNRGQDTVTLALQATGRAVR